MNLLCVKSMKYRWRRGEKVCKIQDQIPHLHFLTSCVQGDSGEAFFLPEPNPIIRNFLHEIGCQTLRKLLDWLFLIQKKTFTT